MFSLVRFVDDNIVHICASKSISVDSNGTVYAKYKNGSRYEAEILSKNDSRSYLSKQMRLLSFNDKKEAKVIVHDITYIDKKGQITNRHVNSRNNERQKNIALNLQHNSEDVSKENIDGYNNVVNFENCAIDNNYEDDNQGKHNIRLNPDKKPKDSAIVEDVVKCNTYNDVTFSSSSDHGDPFSDDDSIKDPHYVDVEEVSSSSSNCENASDNNSPSPLKNDTDPFSDGGSSKEAHYVADGVLPFSDRETVSAVNKSTNYNENDASRRSPLINSDYTEEFQMKLPEKKKKSPKKNCCIFCLKLYSKLPEHLEMKHNTESEVKFFANMPKGCKDRRVIIETLRRKGNYEYSQKNKTIVMCRRPQNKFSGRTDQSNHYIPCPSCKGFFSKFSLRKHFRKCSESNSNYIQGQKNVLIMSRSLKMNVSSKANDILRTEVLPVLRNDEITDVIKYDDLIIIHGNKLCIKYRAQKHHQYMIRQRLRQAARFLINIKSAVRSINDLGDCFHPRHIDETIMAINKMARMSDSTDTYSAPSTAITVGTLLKDIGDTFRIECMKRDEEEKIKQIDRFLVLLNDELKVKVNKTVLEDQKQRSRKKNIVLPTTSDIQLLHTFLTINRRKAFESLKEKFSFNTWRDLSSFVLVNIQLFNKRRAGEIERVHICDFENYQKLSDENNDLFITLDKTSKKAAEKYVRFEIRGKLGRGVPVLLHTELVESIKLIIKCRSAAGVTPTNPFVFGMPSETNSHHYLRATHLLRKFAVECGAKNPTTLRGTTLRKHFATTCVALDLNENEVSDVANFMGHHEKIHHKHYRMSVPSKDIINMSKLLEKVLGANPDEDDESDENFDETENTNVNALESIGCTRDGDSSGTGKAEAEPDTQLNEEISARRGYRENIECTRDGDSSGTGKAEVEPDTHLNEEISVRRRNRGIHKEYVPRRSWSSPERKQVMKLCDFQTFKLPTLQACQKLSEACPELQGRSPEQIKTWISNQYKSNEVFRLNRQAKKTVVSWNSAEKRALKSAFGSFIDKGSVPGLQYIKQVKLQFESLSNRSETTIKAKLHNDLKKRNK